MSKLVPPHGGGELKPLLAPVEDRDAGLARAAALTPVPMTTRKSPTFLCLLWAPTRHSTGS